MTGLIDRYVRTALRRVPEQQRTDIDRELRASIEDAVDARVDSGTAYDAAVEEALLELGDPDSLADRYAGRRTYLIGPELFGAWRRLLIMLFTVVLPIIIAVGVIGEAIGGATVGEIIGGAIGLVFTVGAHLAFWPTLLFAVLERTGHDKKELGLVWKPADLPRYRDGRPVDTQLIVDLSWLALLAAGLVLQQFTFTAEPVLDPANWTSWWPYLLVVLALEAGHAIWVSRLTVRTHLATALRAILALAFAGPLIYLLATDHFFNPAASFATLGDGSAERWATPALITMVALAALWDIIDQAIRTQRSRTTTTA